MKQIGKIGAIASEASGNGMDLFIVIGNVFMMEKEQKSFKPDGVVEQEATTPTHVNSGDSDKQTTASDGGKDEGQAYTDYNGNSEENAPARARED